MNNLGSTRLLIGLFCLLVFYVFTAIYFYPEVFEGKTLGQSDLVQFQGMAKRAQDYREANNGKLPLWNDAMFSGMPDYQISSSPAPKLLYRFHAWVMQSRFLFDKDGGSLMFTMLVCFWILLLSYQVNPVLAALGALAFALGTYNIINIEVGHSTKVQAIAYAALTLGGLRLLFRNLLLLGTGVTAFGLSMQILVYHYQITFYLFLVCLIYGASELVFAIREKRFQQLIVQVGIIVLCSAIAVSSNLGKILMTLEYTPYSMRGEREIKPLNPNEEAPKEGLDKDYAFSWSQGITESFTLLVPYWRGGSSTAQLPEDSQTYNYLMQMAQSNPQMRPQVMQFIQRAPLYWGPQPFTAGPLYAGAVVCFLFVFSMLVLEDRHRWWMLGGVILTLMLAWGDNLAFFNYFLFDNLPLFNKFRSVSMALAIGLTILPLAAVLATDRLLKAHDPGQFSQKLLIALGVTAGLLALLLLSSGVWSYMSSPNEISRYGDELAKALRADRKSLLRSDIIRSLGLVLLSGGLLLAYVKKWIKWQGIPFIALIIMVLDLLVVSRRQIQNELFTEQPVEDVMRKTPADEAILKDDDIHYRVLSFGNPFNEAQTSYFHKSVGGYSPAKMQRYQDVIERHITREMQQVQIDRQQGQFKFENYDVLNMLNTKYFKIGNRQQDVFQNFANLGDAWFVERILPVNSPDEEIKELALINTDKTAIVDASKFEIDQKKFTIDSARLPKIILTEYDNRHLKYEYESPNDGFVVFSEVYYPEGWEVTIDGQPAELVRANYILRAMPVPAGNHTIEMNFNPWSVSFGYSISQISGTLALLLFLGGVGFVVVRQAKGEPKPAVAPINTPPPSTSGTKSAQKPETQSPAKASKPKKKKRKK